MEKEFFENIDDINIDDTNIDDIKADDKSAEEIETELLEIEDKLKDEPEDSGNTFSSITKIYAKNKPLSKQETRELFIKLLQTENAADAAAIKQQIFTGYTRFLFYAVKRNSGLAPDYDLEDLMQEGAIALWTAIGRYDIHNAENAAFSTYAYGYIFGYVSRYKKTKLRAIRLPAHTEEKIIKITKTYDKLLLNNIEPTIKELSKETGFSEKDVKKYMEYQQNSNLLSLNCPCGTAEDETTLESFVPCSLDTESDVLKKVNNENALQTLIKFKDTGLLSQREFDILAYRFGFAASEPMTLNELGNMYGITRERVRQIEKKAIEKISRRRNLLYE